MAKGSDSSERPKFPPSPVPDSTPAAVSPVHHSFALPFYFPPVSPKDSILSSPKVVQHPRRPPNSIEFDRFDRGRQIRSCLVLCCNLLCCCYRSWAFLSHHLLLVNHIQCLARYCCKWILRVCFISPNFLTSTTTSSHSSEVLVSRTRRQHHEFSMTFCGTGGLGATPTIEAESFSFPPVIPYLSRISCPPYYFPPKLMLVNCRYELIYCPPGLSLSETYTVIQTEPMVSTK